MLHKMKTIRNINGDVHFYENTVDVTDEFSLMHQLQHVRYKVQKRRVCIML